MVSDTTSAPNRNGFRNPEISEPMVTPIYDGWEFAFLDGYEAGVIIQVHNVHRDRNTNLVCEVDIGHTESSIPTILGQRLDISNHTAQMRLAREIKSISDRELVPWDFVLLDVFRRTIVLYRQGGQAEDVYGTNEYVPPEYLAYPLIAKGHPNIWFGDGGSEKTTLAVTAALLIAFPLPDNPLMIRQELPVVSATGMNCPTLANRIVSC